MARTASFDQPRGSEHAIVVLGCRVRQGRPGPALLRRLKQAAEVHSQHPELPVIMSGGRVWEGHTEADVMGNWWAEQVASRPDATRETSSLTTRQNAAEVAQLCQALGYRHIILVTCDFHMNRAARLFSKQNLSVTPSPARVERSFSEKVRLSFREWGAGMLGRWESLVR